MKNNEGGLWKTRVQIPCQLLHCKSLNMNGVSNSHHLIGLHGLNEMMQIKQSAQYLWALSSVNSHAVYCCYYSYYFLDVNLQWSSSGVTGHSHLGIRSLPQAYNLAQQKWIFFWAQGERAEGIDFDTNPSCIFSARSLRHWRSVLVSMWLDFLSEVLKQRDFHSKSQHA